MTPALHADVAAPPPTAPAVSAALTDTTVRVSSDFRGDRIVLYGAVFDPKSRPSDVVVIVRGPDEPIRIARKSRVAGLWVNSRPVVFQGAPGFYIAASTRPLDDIARFGVLRRLGAGVDHLAINAPAEQRVETRYGVRDMVVSRLGADYLDWRRAVIRLKEKDRLYDVDDHGVRFVDRGLFRAEIALPAEAPIGRYNVRILLFQGGQPVSEKDRTLTVEQVGVERALYLWAHRRPWSYGLAAMAFALSAGWAASSVFRRD
ncbi:MAG: TIGR02186 family protein [Phenylobacterium sp.]